MTVEVVYRSLVYGLSTVLPSGVPAIDGEAYGVRYEDPKGKNPSVSVSLNDIETDPIELGTSGRKHTVVYIVSAKSRVQRDALKEIVYQYLMNDIPLYSNTKANFTVPSGSEPTGYLAVNEPILIRNMPDFEQNREQFFWTASIFVTMTEI